MNESMMTVRSASDMTVVINVPDLALHRVWKKRGAQFTFDRTVLEQAYYTPAVEFLFKNGILVTDDKQFMLDVGLIAAEDEKVEVVELTDALLNRLIKTMPLRDVKEMLAKLSLVQLDELGNYAIDNWKNLSMDRIDLLSKATHKDILKAIENLKAEED